MILNFKDLLSILISALALTISIINLYLYILDIKPTLKIGFYIAEEVVIEDKYSSVGFLMKYYSVDIVNHSSRRIKVANVSIEWMKSRWFNRQKCKVNYPDFRNTTPNEVISSFWIEPWGDESFIATEDEFTNWLWPKAPSKELWARIIVTDALGKRYHSQILKV